MLKIGLLLPNSRLLPRFGRSFKLALEIGLSEVSDGVSFISEAGGSNANHKSVLGGLENLILQHEPDLLIAPLNVSMLEELEPLLQAEETPLLAVTMGENRISNNLDSDLIRVSSYGLWESAWLTAYNAVKQHGERVALVSSFHESGYGFAEAIDQGANAAGGHLASIVVTREKRSERSRAQSFEDTLAVPTDSLIVNYSTEKIGELNSAIGAIGLNNLPPLWALPMAVDEVSVNPELSHLVGMKSFLPQGHSRCSDEMKSFSEVFMQQSKRAPNVYTLQAFKTGKLMGQYIAGQHFDQASMFFEGCEFFKPENSLTDFDQRELSTQQVDESYPITNSLLNSIMLPNDCHWVIQPQEEVDNYRGWLNPYLVI